MHDIRLALGLIGFLSVGIFLGFRRLLRFTPPRALDAVAVGLMLLMAAYLKFVWGQLWIVNWIPLPSVIVLSNWFPLLLAGMAAVVWIRMGGEASLRKSDGADQASVVGSPGSLKPAWMDRTLGIRRIFMMGIILAGAIWSVMYFIPAEPHECGDEWAAPPPLLEWPVCLQTHPDTCSAASSATILKTLGIEATEQEMAELCLTRRGTTWLGLYHGLATKLMGTRHKVEFFESDVASLPALAEKSALLLCCQLNSETAQQVPEYVTHGGWKPGIAHSVVYFGLFEGRHIVGDPSRGYEAWSDQDLDILWTRQGLRISDRPNGSGADAS